MSTFHVHVLQHVPFEGLGSIKTWLSLKNARITYTRFFQADPLPDLAAIDLVIALGGPMSVNDENQFPWLKDEKIFVAEAVHAGKAVLGICLGAQLIAAALGGQVYTAPEKEIGWFPVAAESNPPGAFVFPESMTVFHWHGETFDLPIGALHLAGSAGCRHQAFQIGAHVLGLQFHLETTPASAEALIANCRHELVPQRYVQSEDQIRSVPEASYRSINALMVKVLEFLSRTAG